LLTQELVRLGLRVQVLCSDEMHEVLTPQPNYSHQELSWFYDSMAFIGKLLAQHGVNVVFTVTTPGRFSARTPPHTGGLTDFN